MLPVLAPGDRLLVVPPGLVPLRRGTIVVVPDPRTPGRDTVKRVVGLPGEVVELRAGGLHVDGRPHPEPYVLPDPDASGAGETRWALGPGQAVVLGDHRGRSTDSRTFGPVAVADLRAVVVAARRPWRWLLPPGPTAA